MGALARPHPVPALLRPSDRGQCELRRLPHRLLLLGHHVLRAGHSHRARTDDRALPRCWVSLRSGAHRDRPRGQASRLSSAAGDAAGDHGLPRLLRHLADELERAHRRDWFGNIGADWGYTAIEDQQLGGGIAWGIGEFPTLFVAIMVAVQWAKSSD